MVYKFETCTRCQGSGISIRRKIPGMILVRPATTRHRVVLINQKPAYSIVIRTKYVREWGFFTSKGWQNWKDYFKERKC